MTMTDRIRGGGLRALAGVAALATLAACSSAPNDVGEGVGFSDYQSYQTRRAAIGTPVAPPQAQPRRTVQTALPPADVTAQPFGTTPSGQAWTPGSPQAAGDAGLRDVASLASAAIAEAEGRGAMGAAPAAPAPVASAPPAGNGAGLPPVTASGDNFVAPPLPEGMAVLGANVVAFALSTRNAVGERVHARNPLRLGRPEVRCGDFRTTDLAQDWFLTNDGPERDRAGLDPDGDGFACNWDPERYRAEARAARQASVPGFGAMPTDG
jgi:hypothetical protein